MKLNNILLLIAIAALGFTACTSDDIPGDPANTNTTLSLVMSVADVQTRAGIATDKELNINNCHVAVFDVTDVTDTATAVRVAHFENFVYSKETRQATVTMANLAAGSSEAKAKKYLFYVIANSSNNFNSDADYGTYQAYMDYTESASAFAEDKLVKAGQTVQSVYWNNTNPRPVSVTVDLIQLTARVEFQGIVEIKTKAATTPVFQVKSISFYNGTGINTSSDITIYNTDELENGVYSKGTPGLTQNTPFYTYETAAGIQLEISGNWSASPKTQKTYLLTLPDLIKGNRYAIRGTVVPSVDVNPTISWKVVPVTVHDEDIPEIGFN